jgi:cell division protein FtsL
MAANSYWVDQRLRAQQVTARTIPNVFTERDFSREMIATRAEVRLRGGLIPSWVVFGMIILATFALCVTVTMRTRAEAKAAMIQHEKISSDVQQLRTNNAALEQEVRRLSSDPRAIEAAARTRLNMVRANEIVVTVE